MNQESRNIKIRMQFLNNPAIIFFLFFEFFVFIYLGVTTNIFNSNTPIVLLLFGIFGCTFLIAWFVFRIRVILDFELGKPRITAKGLLSKTVIVWPFQFCMGKQLIRINNRYSRINDYLMIYTEFRSLTMSVKSTDIDKDDTYYLEQKTSFLDTYTAIGESKHLMWETLWLLESFEKDPDAEIKTTKRKIDSSNDLIERLKQTEEKEFNPFKEG